MGNKRIYLGRESSKYAKIAGGAIVTITSLFFVLMAMGFEITGTDDICSGTIDNPCVSYGKICNLGPDNYDIYNPDEVKMDFSPTVKNYWMFFKDGRVKKNYFLDKGINFDSAGWRFENFTDATKPRKDRVYVHRFARYSCQEYMLVGLKENPNDIIKWGIGVGKEYLDPFWYGVNETPTTSVSTSMNIELGTSLNLSTNITGVSTVCVDINHPDYGVNYTCGSPTANFNIDISYFNQDEFSDDLKEKEFEYTGSAQSENTLTNKTFNISFNGLDNITSAYFGLFGEIASLFTDTETAGSSSGSTVNGANGYDENWGTYGSVTRGTAGSSSGNIYVNYTIPSGIGNVNATVKGGPAFCSGCSLEIFRYGCWNYTSSAWIVDLVEITTTGVQINEVEIPAGCLNGDVLQTSMYMAGTNPAAGRSFGIYAYEDSIEWINYSYPNGIKIYANNTLQAYFDGELIGSEVHYDSFNDSLKTKNITFIEAGANTVYISLNKYANVTSATINATGYTYRGGIIDYWYNDKDAYGIDVNSTGDYYQILNQPVAKELEFKVYNLTTKIGTGYIIRGSTDSDYLGGLIDRGLDAFGDPDFCYLNSYIDEQAGHTYLYLTCSVGGSGTSEELIIDPTGYPGDMTHLNSTYGMYVREKGVFFFHIFKYSDLSSSSAIGLSGMAYGIASGDTEDDVWILTRVGSSDYRILLYNLAGTYQGYGFNTTYTSSNEARVLDYDKETGLFYTIGEDKKIIVYSNSSIYPKDILIDVGSDGILEYEGSGNLTTEIEIDLNITAINNYLDSCTEITCLVPITIYSSSPGVFEYSDISIVQDVSNITLNISEMNAALSGINSASDIVFEIENNVGNISVQNLSFNYLGSNDTIEVLTWNASNKLQNETLNLFYYYSSYKNELPYTWTDDLFFLPRTNSSKNVSAYAQSSIIPIYNITTSNSAKNLNLSIRINETISCMNITWGLNSTIVPSNVITTSWQEIATDLEYLNNTQIWMYANLENCDPNVSRILNPSIELESYCVDCVWG